MYQRSESGADTLRSSDSFMSKKRSVLRILIKDTKNRKILAFITEKWYDEKKEILRGRVQFPTGGIVRDLHDAADMVKFHNRQ